MTRPLHITIDPERVSPSRALMAAVRAGQSLIVVSTRAFGELVAERGSVDAALRHLLRCAENGCRPIGVNLEGHDGNSTTAFIAPRVWSSERLAGWVAGHHQALEAAFGATTWRAG
jgi:hypothetical protein